MNKNYKVRKGNINRRRRKKGTSKTVLLSATLAAVVLCIIVAVILILVASKTDTNDARSAQIKENELTVSSISYKGETVVIETTYCTVKYPFAFSDIIRTEPLNYDEYSELKFVADIGNHVADLFSLRFNNENGISIGEIKIGKEAVTVPVTVEIYEPGDDLQNDELSTFYAALETLNDVINSLAENEKFTLADIENSAE